MQGGQSSGSPMILPGENDVIVPESAPWHRERQGGRTYSSTKALISARKSSKRAKIERQPDLLAHLARSSPRLTQDGTADVFSGLRSYERVPVAGTIAHAKGQRRPTLPSQDAVDAFKKEKAIAEALQVMNEPMAAKVILFHEDEKEAIGPVVFGERTTAHLRKHAGSGAQMHNAVLALLSLALFAKEHFGLVKETFEFSSGLISIYLGSMTALTMPRSRLSGLRFAQRVFGAFCDASNSALDPYMIKVSMGGHAPATPLSVVLHLFYLATNSTSTIIRVYAASFCCMLLTSLRYCDAMRSGTPRKTGQAFDGVARKGKMLAQPMLWYCPRKDFSGSCLWSETWMEQLSLLGRDHLFPDFVGGCISDATVYEDNQHQQA